MVQKQVWSTSIACQVKIGEFKVASFYSYYNSAIMASMQGAATTCYVALHPSLKGVTGKYFIDCNEEMPSYWAKDETLAKRLWDFSEKLTQSTK